MKRRFLSLLLAVLMIAGMLPATALAAELSFDNTTGYINSSNQILTIGGTNLDLKASAFGDNTDTVTIPAMYKGKYQKIQLSLSGGKAATWSQPWGDMPDGLELDPSKGTISGKLQSTGSGRVLIEATANDGSGSRSIWVYYDCFEPSDRPVISNDPTLPEGAVGESYNASLYFNGASNGVVTWKVVEGKLPDGLKLYTSVGTRWITGTPTKDGTFNFKLQVTTVAGTSESKQFTITIDKEKQAPTFSKLTLYAEADTNYTEAAPLGDLDSMVTSKGYPAVAKWEPTSVSGLPEGLTLNAYGIITGQVSSAEQGNYYVKATCTDANSVRSHEASLEVFVYAKPTIATKEGESTTKTVKAGEYFIWSPLTGNNSTYTYWKIVSGPSAEQIKSEYGLEFNDLSCCIWGTATKSGEFTITVQRLCRNNTGEDIALTDPAQATLKVVVEEDRRFVVSSTDCTFPSVQKPTDGSYTPPAAKSFDVISTGYSPVKVNVALSGANADAFELSGTTSGTLTKGTETSGLSFSVRPKANLDPGTYNATVTIADSADASSQQTIAVKFTVSAIKVSLLIINGYELPYALAGQTYQYQFVAEGRDTYKWSLASDAPAGMTIGEDTGLLTWEIPADYFAKGGTSQRNFHVTAADPSKLTSTNTKDFLLPIYGQPVITMKYGGDSSIYTGNVLADGRIILDDGYVGTEYKVKKGTAEYNLMYTVTGTLGSDIVLSAEGLLPPGMSLSGDETYWKELCGTPTAAGTYDFTIVAKQYVSGSDHTQLINEARLPLRVTIYETFTMPGDIYPAGTKGITVGTPINIDLNQYVAGGKPFVSDGKKHYKFNVASFSTILEGLTLSENGILSGALKKVSTSNSFSFDVQDANGKKLRSSIDFFRAEFPPLELDTPDGSTFMDQISVGLSDAYLDTIGSGYDYKLSYTYKVFAKNNAFKFTSGVTEISADGSTPSYLRKVVLSADEIQEKLTTVPGNHDKTLLEGDKVELEVKLYAGDVSTFKTVTLTKVAAPTKPTAYPCADTAGGTYPFSGAEQVQLSTTSGSNVGICYTTDGTDPQTSATAQDYSGTPIPLTGSTTIKARSFVLVGTERRYSDLAEFKYEKVAAVGVTVSGTVTSYLSDTETVTVKLSASGTTTAATQTATATGSSTTYTFEAVPAGTYTLQVSKKNHVTREYTITVAETPVTQNATICPLGDVNMNGETNSIDYQRLFEHVQEISLITDPYQLLIADVNNNGSANSVDYQRLFEHVQEISPLY